MDTGTVIGSEGRQPVNLPPRATSDERLKVATATEPLLFDLRFRKECYEIRAGQKPRRLTDRDRTLPDEPPWFKPMRGNHGPVHEKATKLNEAQTRSGYLDYFFFPKIAETVKSS